jgi:DNA-binding SARP family transcriptional activator
VGSNEHAIGATLRPMERRLLAALAVRRPAPVPVDSLAEALWPSGLPPSAKKTVQNNVLRLRRKLGWAVIETVGSSYRLGDEVEVDIERFERAAGEAARSTDSGSARWDAVLAWCDAEPLDELRHWQPADGRRAELEELRRSAGEARWEAVLEDGVPVDIVPQLEALVAEEPLRERRWSLLLQAYGRAGRRAEGLRAFERARQTLAREIGVPPGAELVEAYEALLLDDAAPDHQTTAGGATRSDSISLSDHHRSEGVAALRRGDPTAAVRSFTTAARLAREAGDLRRFAEAALGASGDGWRTSLDAADEVVSLLAEAADRVPPGPTPLRSRLLARLAVARSHHAPASECALAARKALAIARAVDRPELVAGALHALGVVVWDPARRDEQAAWIVELLSLADAHRDQPWRRWALPLVARRRATDGDVAGACEALDELSEEASKCGDAVGLFGAAHGPVLRATVVGDWAAARAAAAALRVASETAVFDPAGPALMEMGMVGIIELLSGPTDVAPLAPIEWPLPSLELVATAWHANCLARVDQLDRAVDALGRIDSTTIVDVERDGYWLSMLSMLADAAHITDCRPIAEAVSSCLQAYIELTIVDPGLLYLGAAAHAAGLAAATCGHRNDAVDLLSIGLSTHTAHGSPWMAQRSRDALASLAADRVAKPEPR